MNTLPSEFDSITTKNELVELIKDILSTYSEQIETITGELEVQHYNHTNWLFFNSHYQKKDSEFGNNIFGVAESYELQSCKGFNRLAAIDVSDAEIKVLYAYCEDSELECLGEFDADKEKDLENASKAIAYRVVSILNEMGVHYE